MRFLMAFVLSSVLMLGCGEDGYGGEAGAGGEGGADGRGGGGGSDPCDDISVDQCNIIWLEWDDLAASDLYCENQPWIAFRFAWDVLQAVSRLALPPPL